MSSYLYRDTNVATRMLRCALRPQGTSAQSTRGASKNHGPLHQDLHLAQSKAGELHAEQTTCANTWRRTRFSLPLFLSFFSLSFSQRLHHTLFSFVLYSSSQRHERQIQIKKEKSSSERVGISSLLIRVTRACNARAIIIRMITACGGSMLHVDVPARICSKSYLVGWKEMPRCKHQSHMNHELTNKIFISFRS